MSEALLQNSVAAYLNGLEKEGKLFFYHPPNSIYTSKAQAGKHKAAGMKAGVPDCCIVLHGGIAAFIELKWKGNYCSPAQKDVHDKLTSLMAPVFTVTADNPYIAIAKVKEILTDLGVAI